MDQVSKPVLIALIAAVAVLGAKFTILRSNDGGGSTPASATAPGQTGLQNAIDKANNAVGVSKQSAAKHEQAAAQASGDSTATSTPSKSKATATPASKASESAKPKTAPAKPAKPKPTLAPGDKSGPILQDLDRGKVVVALFFNPHGADDNAALRAVRHADRHHGRVIVHSIPIDDVGDYNALTTGVEVLQAPTIMVIGPDHKARTIVGYTDVKEVDQTVGDVGGKGFEAKAAVHLRGFAAKAHSICDGDGFKIETSGLPTSIAELEPFLARSERTAQHGRHRLAGVPAKGAKQIAAKRAVLAGYDGYIAAIESARHGLKSGAAPGPVVLAMAQKFVSVTKRYAPAMHAVHERTCLG